MYIIPVNENWEFGQANIVDTDEGTLSLVPPIGDTSFKPITFTFTAISEQGSTNEDCFVLIAEPVTYQNFGSFQKRRMSFSGKIFYWLKNEANRTIQIAWKYL